MCTSYGLFLKQKPLLCWHLRLVCRLIDIPWLVSIPPVSVFNFWVRQWMGVFHTEGEKKQLLMDLQKNTEMLLKCTQKHTFELRQRHIYIYTHINKYMELYVLADSIGACIDGTCQDFYTVNAKPFKAESAVITSKSSARFFALFCCISRYSHTILLLRRQIKHNLPGIV